MDERLLHETKIHGTVEFPFAVYLGRVPEYITAFPRHWHEEAELIYVTALSLFSLTPSTLSNKPSPRRRSIIILCSIFRFWGRTVWQRSI